MFILMDIGCLECGVESEVIGLFTDKEEAQKLANQFEADKDFNWRGGGQHTFEVFQLPILTNVIATDYVK